MHTSLSYSFQLFLELCVTSIALYVDGWIFFLIDRSSWRTWTLTIFKVNTFYSYYNFFFICYSLIGIDTVNVIIFILLLWLLFWRHVFFWSKWFRLLNIYFFSLFWIKYTTLLSNSTYEMSHQISLLRGRRPIKI